MQLACHLQKANQIAASRGFLKTFYKCLKQKRFYFSLTPFLFGWIHASVRQFNFIEILQLWISPVVSSTFRLSKLSSKFILMNLIKRFLPWMVVACSSQLKAPIYSNCSTNSWKKNQWAGFYMTRTLMRTC